MSKVLNNYKPGLIVSPICPGLGCEKSFAVLLGEEDPLRPEFTRLGKLGSISWQPGKSVKIFHINSKVCCLCPDCKEHFSFVAVISRGKSKSPLIIAYNSGTV